MFFEFLKSFKSQTNLAAGSLLNLVLLVKIKKKMFSFATPHRAMFKSGGQLLSVLCRCNLLEIDLTVPGMETIFTKAEMKERSILDNLAISNLQIITESGRSGLKFKLMI